MLRLNGLAPFLLLLFAFAAAGGGAAAEEQAVIAGTVFRDPGFALGGAEVTLAARTQPEGAKKFKPRKIRSDARGEFAFYVPAAKASYVLSVKAEGLESQEKTVELAGGAERTDTYFTLKPSAAAPGKD